MNPSEEQKRIIEAEGPSVVIAGPGSGKTAVLTAKAAWITKEKPQASVLCITHTRRASEEMKNRMGKQRSVEISTIHSLCYRLLRGPQRIDVISDYDRAVIARIAAERAGLAIDHKEAESAISRTKLGIDPINEDTQRLLVNYERLKKDRLDYDDLLLYGAKAARGGKWSHILIDEAQDLDPMQIEIIKKIAPSPPNVTFFSAPTEAIFGFKGASPGLKPEQIFPNTRLFYLTENYRLTKRILKCADALIARNGEESFARALREAGSHPIWVKVADEMEEAKTVAKMAKRLIEAGLPAREILILYRVNHYRAEIEEACLREEIPYSVLKNASVFKKEGPLSAFLLEAWRPNPQAESTLLIDYLGRRTAEEIIQTAEERSLPPLQAALEESILRTGIRKPLETLLEDIRKIQNHRHEPPEAMKKAWETIEKRGLIADTKEAKGLARAVARMENLGELAECADAINRMSQSPREKRIHLSTIHRAKGSQHSAVFVLGMVEGNLPLAVRDAANIPEERRLAYVALTRAKDAFVATAPQSLYSIKTTPSRFIREMDLKEAELRQN